MELTAPVWVKRGDRLIRRSSLAASDPESWPSLWMAKFSSPMPLESCEELKCAPPEDTQDRSETEPVEGALFKLTVLAVETWFETGSYTEREAVEKVLDEYYDFYTEGYMLRIWEAAFGKESEELAKYDLAWGL